MNEDESTKKLIQDNGKKDTIVQIDKIDESVGSNSSRRKLNIINNYVNNPGIYIPGPQQKNNLTEEESEAILNELRNLVDKLKEKKKSFKDTSRLFCCGCFSFGIILLIIVFYIFDVMKYNETCMKSKKSNFEICEAPTIGFWTRFIFIALAVNLLLIGLYCTGPTVIIFEPNSNKLSIDKKKLFCLPSICEYPISELSHALIESDSSDGTPNLSAFHFYSVTLVFNNDKERIVNLGLGRDCFFLQEKIELVNKINRYIEAIKTDSNINYFN
jgi:hypothetical protein